MLFDSEYKRLNPEQKRAVDSIDGPVMVVAGPGTGKTQVIALRIGHILQATDTPPDSILCLTFTRSGVSAMRSRLETYIGPTARNVTITTFHSFAISLIERHFTLLDFHTIPQLLDDTQAVVVVDELLQNGTWEYLRPRTDPTKYFRDLKSLISILKREGIKPDDFLVEVEREIKDLQNDPENISSRGASKGELKKEVEKKIESLNRSREVVLFYEQYENTKRESGFMDYDDVLTYAVELVENYEDVRADIRENYHYVLVDEHQDSSGVQNAFLKAVWKETESPNIFVVGDDRQLIYGFSGANLDYFTEFKTFFGEAKLIVLEENYRSTAPILALADDLLASSMTDHALKSNIAGGDRARLLEYNYSRDEIVGAGLYFQKVLKSDNPLKSCALLLPKNHQVRTASALLRAMGLPVVSEQNISLLELPETRSLMRVLGLVADPFDSLLISELVLDKSSGIPPLEAHRFLKSLKKVDAVTLDELTSHGSDENLFSGASSVAKFGERLKNWVDTLAHERVSHVVSVVGNEFLIDTARSHEELLRAIEIVRSLLHASFVWEEKHPTGTLGDFIEYFTRLATYGNHVEVARLDAQEGIHVMTLHRSKGLEYDHVWIAHMNEEILMSEKHTPFTLPESIKNRIAERDELVAKRELYVAITRAKRFCSVSYARMRDDGVDMNLANIISEISDGHFEKSSAEVNEKEILTENPRLYAPKYETSGEENIRKSMQDFVREKFADTKISVSMLNNFFECPRKWYFRNFLRLPEAKSVSLALGSAVHGAIEYVLKEKTLPSAELLKAYIASSLGREGVSDPKEIARLTKDGYSAVKNWIDVYYKDLATDRISERSVTYRDKNFPLLTMYGKIDLTERYPDGTITVTDFKTGSSKTTGAIEKLDEEHRLSGLMRQLAMYSYLIRGAEDKTVTSSRLLFLEEDQKQKNALYSTRIEQEHIDLLVRDITDYQNLLESGEWLERPCNAKMYGSHKECEYCARVNGILGK